MTQRLISAERELLSDLAQGEYFFMELGERTQGPLAVAFGGREWCGADYRVERAGYPFPTLEFVAEGEGELELGDGPVVRLKAGTLFGYGPGLAVRMRSMHAGMLKYFIALTGEGAHQVLEHPVALWGEHCDVGHHTGLRGVWDLLIEEGRDQSPSAPALCLNLLERLRLKLAQAQLPRESSPDYAREKIQECKTLVETEPGRFNSVTAMARGVGISRPLLFRLFRRFLGVTPYQYLLRQKMNRAAHELISTDLLAKEVAARAGFADPLHFSRVFRQVHKTSPSQFRRSHRR